MRISAPVTLGRLNLGPALHPFLLQHPGIELNLELDNHRVDATADGFDVVILDLIAPLEPGSAMGLGTIPGCTGLGTPYNPGHNAALQRSHWLRDPR